MITDPVVEPDQLEIRDVVRDFVRDRFTIDAVRSASTTGEGYDRDSWKLMVELGWAGIAIPERFGGTGLRLAEQCIVLSELGAALVPAPYLATAGFAVAALLGGASEPAMRRRLSEIAAGTQLYAVATSGWPGTGAMHARPSGRDWVLSGHASYCLDAGRADELLVIARVGDHGHGLFAVPAAGPGINVRVVDAVDFTRRIAAVKFADVPAESLHAKTLSEAQAGAIIDRMAVLLSAEMVGATDRCLTITLDYLRTRHQFGGPIGRFQALKHRCADLAVQLTTARELVFAAADAADEGDFTAVAVAAPLSLARASEISKLVAEESIQLHGGIGFTDEAAVGLYYKRALSDGELLAHSVDARARLAAILDYGGLDDGRRLEHRRQ
jgi:alkylation response protein AidB-like acyl-CoA dehydrogenase